MSSIPWARCGTAAVTGKRRCSRRATRRALALADAAGLGSIAFPAISTGVYGFPVAEAARIAVDTVRAMPAGSVREVVFCCFSAADLAIYRTLLDGSASLTG